MTSSFFSGIRYGLLALALLVTGLAHAQRVERPTMQVGDRWKYETKDGLTQLVTGQTERIITAVGSDQIEAMENGLPARYTLDLNPLETPENRFDPASRALSFPFAPGDTWRHDGKVAYKSTGAEGRNQYSVRVVGPETITVPAGRFDTVKLVMEGYVTVHVMGSSRSTPFVRTYWYAPTLKAYAKIENDARGAKWSAELIESSIKP